MRSSSRKILEADAWDVADLVRLEDGVAALVNSPSPAGQPQIHFFGDDGSRGLLDTGGIAIGSGLHSYGVLTLGAAGRDLLTTDAAGGLWAVCRNESAAPLVNVVDTDRFGDPVCAADRLFAVLERERPGDVPLNALVEILADGRVVGRYDAGDFVSRPASNPAGDCLAFLGWDLPHMPWERTKLFVADLRQEFQVLAVEAPQAAALAQPLWSPDGILHVLCDAGGYFGLWRCQGARLEPVSVTGGDIGLSMSRQSARSYAFMDSNTARAVEYNLGVPRLVEIDLETGDRKPLSGNERPIDLLVGGNGRVVYVGAPLTGPIEIRELVDGEEAVLWRAPGENSDDEAAVECVSFAAADDAAIYANFWPAPPGARRHFAIVNFHGGPHALAPRRLKGPLRILWQAGYDVLDLNYRGSAGFGRAYRERLDGRWGLADVEDALSAIRWLESRGMPPHRIVLRGASAGGFTVLNVLAEEQELAGGISYYGVADLSALAAETHKYESGFLKTLLGSENLKSDVFVSRSPLTRIDRIGAPLLLLQGQADAVVPPGQSIRMVDALRARGNDVTLRLFEDEGHGFRKMETQIASIEAELSFLDSLAQAEDRI